MSNKSSHSIPADKKKWEKAKKLADEVYKKPSAYKAGFIVKKYKESGGTFLAEKKKTKGLSRWFAEKWVNQHGTVGYQHKNDVYRPSIRVNKKTPVSWGELSSYEIEKAKRSKSKGNRVKRFKD